MKLVALGLIVGGWMVAVGGLVVSDAIEMRMVATLLGLATSLGGIGALNGAHVQNVFWKTRGH